MPFTPLRLLVVYDDALGFCGRVVPRMKQMLEDRAFEVDTRTVDEGPIDVRGYRGVVVGTPVFGLGIRHPGPTPKLTEFLKKLDGLDEKKVAAFCVYAIRPGTTFDRLKCLLLELGADVVATHAYSLTQPDRGDHVLPAECMVRIR